MSPTSLTDFGLVTDVEQVAGGEAAGSGILPETAPEQVAGEILLRGFRSEFHALGVVVDELLT